MIQWDDPHIIPANMTVEVSELFTRELTRVTKIFLSFMVIFGYFEQEKWFCFHIANLSIYDYLLVVMLHVPLVKCISNLKLSKVHATSHYPSLPPPIKKEKK